MPTSLARRRHLHALLRGAVGTSAWVAAALPASASAQAGRKPDVLLGGSRYRQSADAPQQYALVALDVASGAVRQAPTEFFPHGLAFARAGRWAYAFEKIGPGAALLDLDRMAVLERVPPVQGRLFYGHGACHAAQGLLYSTETSADGTGAIGVREVRTQRYVGDFPTYGANPHECQLIEDDTVLAVTNGGSTGSRASLAYIDVASGRLLERFEMPDARFNTGHFAALPQRAAVVVSAPRHGLDATHLGAVSVKRAGGGLQPLGQPTTLTERLWGESLSVLHVPEADLFVVTHPTPGLVSCWRWSSQALLQTLGLPHARGLALSADRQRVWISHGLQASLLSIDVASLQVDAASRREHTLLAGSHLVLQP